MVININLTGIINPTFLFIIILGLIILIVAILYSIDYQLKKKKALQESSLEYRYSLRLQALKKEKIAPVEFVVEVDRLAKDFIQEKLKVNSKLDYSQLLDSFKDKPYVLAFCQTMLEIMYAGEKINLNDARTVLNNLEMMLRQEGALIEIKSKPSKLDETNFITDLAKKIEKTWYSKKETNKIEPSKEDLNNIKQDKVEIKDKSGESFSTMLPISKKTIDVSNYKTSPLNKKEYKNIESIDSLDRIKHRVQKHKTSRKSPQI